MVLDFDTFLVCVSKCFGDHVGCVSGSILWCLLIVGTCFGYVWGCMSKCVEDHVGCVFGINLVVFTKFWNLIWIRVGGCVSKCVGGSFWWCVGDQVGGEY
jgi:hypothetical protein